ncbi:MAG: LysR family transcriptional regulator [Alphaproteobacteria bacterium]|jgi:molybdate transport repressor ModE-like protein|nr:LysR family transcriptional regulator [Alphaproteobacteria bacterium]
MISVKHLQILAAVTRSGSVTAAAKQLNVSQPTASKALRRLEDVAGTPLFERMDGRMMPTTEALILAREANHLIDEWGTYQNLITNISRRSGDRLRVAASPTYSATIMPRLLKRMSVQHSEVHIQCDVLPTTAIVDATALGKLDVGIVHYTEAEPKAVATPICKASVVCIMPTDHPLTQKSVVEASDFKDWQLVGYRRDLPLARMIGEHLGTHGVLPNVSVEANYTSLIRDLVRLGAGIAVIDPFTLLFEVPDDIQIRPIKPIIEVTMAAIYAQNRPLSRNAKMFVQTLRDTLPPSTLQGGKIKIFDAK